VVIPALAAADAAALRVECALKILVSIPALSIKDLSHLAEFFFPAFSNNTRLCPRQTLQGYERRTEPFRIGESEEQMRLFLAVVRLCTLPSNPAWIALPGLPPRTPPPLECICDIADLTLLDWQTWMAWLRPGSWPVSRKGFGGARHLTPLSSQCSLTLLIRPT